MRAKHCITLVTVAVMSLFLAFPASTMSYAQAPAGPNRPARVPDGYVITPFGYFHPSCVRHLAEGETLLADGRVVQHADGTLENIPACDYPRYTARGEIVATGAARVEPPFISWSWIVDAETTTSTSYGEIIATWIVPPGPTSNDGQTVYFFPGLVDIDDAEGSIIQPVLGWNSDFGGAWGIASWNCCISGIAWESRAVRVNPGDTILGTTESTCSAGTLSCSTWNITTDDVSSGKSTTLGNTSSEGQTFNWAFAGVLEVYDIARCSDYPPNGAITFSDVALYDYNFALISNPGWSIYYDALGLTPQCNYGGQVAATQVTLDYSDFTLSVTPASQTIQGPGIVYYTVSVTALNGFAGNVSLSVPSGLPTNATYAFSPNPISGGSGSSTLTVTVPTTVSPGKFPLTITGTGGGETQSTSATLVITAPPDFTLSVTPASQIIQGPGIVYYTVSVTAINGFAGDVSLSVPSSLLTGFTYAFSPNPISGGSGNSTLTVTVPTTVSPGTTIPLTITGTSGSVTHSTTATLMVTAPLTVNVTGPGSVTSSPAGINCGSVCSFNFAPGTQVTLTATAGARKGNCEYLATFEGFTGCTAGSGNTCTVTVNSATTVTAAFKERGGRCHR